MDNAFARLPIPHFFRWLLLNTAVFFAYCAFIVPGIIWTNSILKKTGYRTIDLLLVYLVPIGGPITGIRTQWRYCAQTRYWEPAVPTAPTMQPVAA
jgi:hypothetical protein